MTTVVTKILIKMFSQGKNNAKQNCHTLIVEEQLAKVNTDHVNLFIIQIHFNQCCIHLMLRIKINVSISLIIYKSAIYRWFRINETTFFLNETCSSRMPTFFSCLSKCRLRFPNRYFTVHLFPFGGAVSQSRCILALEEYYQPIN